MAALIIIILCEKLYCRINEFRLNDLHDSFLTPRLVSLIEKLNQFWAENGGKYKLIESKLTSSDDFLFIRILIFIQIFNFWTLGKWLCTVVASNTRGPQFESSHWQKFIMNIFTVNCWKDENKKNGSWMAHLKLTFDHLIVSKVIMLQRYLYYGGTNHKPIVFCSFKSWEQFKSRSLWIDRLKMFLLSNYFFAFSKQNWECSFIRSVLGKSETWDVAQKSQTFEWLNIRSVSLPFPLGSRTEFGG